MEGSFVNIIKDGALFAKGHKVEGFLIKLNREEGVLGKCAPLLPPHAQSRGGRRRAPAALGPAALGSRGGWDGGEKEEGSVGDCFPSSI